MVGKTAMSNGSQFSHLLASSRLAGHSPIIPQVYTAPKAQIARGDFGLKRSLPSRNKPLGSLRYVEVEALDTTEGQTIWSEREHEVLLRKRFGEMNVRLTRKGKILSGAEFSELRGGLGPRISTNYDPSTKRSVPTTYDTVSDSDLRQHLQSEARQGQGPIYRTNLHAGNSMSIGLDLDGPFGSRSGEYTVKIPVPVNFHSMDEKQFEKYLEHIRRQRPVYQKIAALRSANQERHKLALRLEQERQKIINSNSVLASSETNQSLTVPEPVSESQLPLPETVVNLESTEENGKNETVDLWDESRTSSVGGWIWRSWLHERDSARASLSIDTSLPSTPAPGGQIRNTPMHPNGGLQYGQPDKLQTKLMADPFPGRVVERQAVDRRHGVRRESGARNSSFSVAVGGQILSMPLRHRSNSQSLLDWTQRVPEKGSVMLKPDGLATFDFNDRSHYSLPVWNDKAGNRNKSASAASMVAEKAAKLAARESASDPLLKYTLPLQFGKVELDVRTENKGTSLARGKPGSAQWVGEIDGRLGYRSGEDEAIPLDYANLSGTMNSSAERQRSAQEFDATFSGVGARVTGFNSARGVGNRMYSARERSRAKRQQEEREARLGKSSSSANNSDMSLEMSNLHDILKGHEADQKEQKQDKSISSEKVKQV